MLEQRLNELTDAVNALNQCNRSMIGTLERLLADTERTARANSGANDATISGRETDGQPTGEPATKIDDASIDDVRRALIAIPKQDARDLLAAYDVSRVTELVPRAYPNIIRDAQRVTT